MREKEVKLNEREKELADVVTQDDLKKKIEEAEQEKCAYITKKYYAETHAKLTHIKNQHDRDKAVNALQETEK